MTRIINYCDNAQLLGYCENGHLETAFREFIREYHGKDVIIRFGSICRLSFPDADEVRLILDSGDGDCLKLTFMSIRRFNRQKIEHLARMFAKECGDFIADELK